MAKEQSGPADMPCTTGHPDDLPWRVQRFPGQHAKMIFHPRPECPTEPNAGLVHYEPGAYHPWHRHDFAQVWYILEGEFEIGGKTYVPGTMLFYPDPHYEEELNTENGGVILFVQYPGPTTGACPIYDGRFNLEKRSPLSQEPLDI